MNKDTVKRNSDPALAVDIYHSSKCLKKKHTKQTNKQTTTNQIKFSNFVSVVCDHRCSLLFEDPSCLDLLDGKHIATGESPGWRMLHIWGKEHWLFQKMEFNCRKGRMCPLPLVQLGKAPAIILETGKMTPCILKCKVKGCASFKDKWGCGKWYL